VATNIDIQQLIKDNPRKIRENGLQDLCKKIVSHYTLYDAISNEATDLKDVNAIKTIFESKVVPVDTELIDFLKKIKLYPWQQILFDEMQTPLREVSDREVNWIFDSAGAKGKTTFMRYCDHMMPRKVVKISSSGQSRDIADLVRNKYTQTGKFSQIIYI